MKCLDVIDPFERQGMLTTSKRLCSTHVVAATYVFFTGYPMHGVGIRTGERR